MGRVRVGPAVKGLGGQPNVVGQKQASHVGFDSRQFRLKTVMAFLHIAWESSNDMYGPN